MGISKWFNSWEWLKCGTGSWNYARITGLFLSCLIQPLVLSYIFLNKELSEIVNLWQWLVIVTPLLFSTLMFLIEIVRDNKALSIKIGDKEYGFNKTKGDVKGEKEKNKNNDGREEEK
jgi:hypothetical protein